MTELKKLLEQAKAREKAQDEINKKTKLLNEEKDKSKLIDMDVKETQKAQRRLVRTQSSTQLGGWIHLMTKTFQTQSRTGISDRGWLING